MRTLDHTNATVADTKSDKPTEGSPRVTMARLTKANRHALSTRAVKANKLSYSVLEAIFRQEPLTRRATMKHSGDLLKQGFTIVEQNTTEPLDDRDSLIQAFWNDRDVNAVVMQALIAAHVYGDGVVEIEWSDDGAASDEPVSETSIPMSVHLVDPTTVEFKSFRDQDGSVKRFLVQRNLGGDDVSLHPDRFHHFKFCALPGFTHGLSTVEAAYHSAIAKVKGDQGTGETLYFSGQPKIWATVEGGNDSELAEVQSLISDDDFVRGFVWNERLQVNQLNPSSVNPGPFYDAWQDSIAAAYGVPKPMLVGAQAGAVSGSMTNIVDYHADLFQTQTHVLTPFVRRITRGLTGMLSDQYDVLWQPFPLSVEVEAAALRDKTTAFMSLINSGVKPLSAARVIGLELNDEDLKEEPQGFLPPVRDAQNVIDEA